MIVQDQIVQMQDQFVMIVCSNHLSSQSGLAMTSFNGKQGLLRKLLAEGKALTVRLTSSVIVLCSV
jgi:hypothetical protein